MSLSKQKPILLIWVADQKQFETRMMSYYTIPTFFYFPDSHVEKEVDGVRYYRNARMPVNAWEKLPHPIDRLIDHIHILTGFRTRGVVLTRIGIQQATISRVRHNKLDMPLDWLVKMADFTGLSLQELRDISGTKPCMKRYNER